MKLIFGFLSLFCLTRLAHCLHEDAQLIGTRPHVFLSFPGGFPDGIHVTFFYKHANLTHGAMINFYGELKIDPTDNREILAHISVFPNSAAVITDTLFQGNHAPYPNGWHGKTKINQLLVGPGKNSKWWRVDVYKFDDNHLNICVQGFWSGVHEFPLPLSAIKSVYVFNSVDTDNVFIKYRLPSSLIHPTTLAHFNNLVNMTMVVNDTMMTVSPPLIPDATETTTIDYTNWNHPEPVETSSNTVFIPTFPKNKKLFLTVWIGSIEENQQGQTRKPRIQFRLKGVGVPMIGLFTIYHEWNANRRKSFIDVLSKENIGKNITLKEDFCKNPDSGFPDACQPVECVGDGSTSDLEHYLIERIGENSIRVTTYYVGANVDPSNGVLGTTCTTTPRLEHGLIKILDHKNGFEIVGLNGASIMHADAEWL